MGKKNELPPRQARWLEAFKTKDWRASKHTLLPVSIIIAVIIGVILGTFFMDLARAISWLGDLFLKLLRMLILPLIIASMVAGVARLGDIRRLGRMGLKTLLYYGVTTLIAVAIGLLITNMFPFPSVAASVRGFSEGNTGSITITSMILNLIPANIFESMVKFEILPIIVFSLLFGMTLSTLGSRGGVIVDFFSALEEVMMKMVDGVILFSAPGIMALVAGRLAKAGGGQAALLELWNLRYYVQNVILGLSLHSLLILPVILFWMGRRNPLRFAAKMSTALATAFSTSSSSATIPVTMECIEEAKIPRKVNGFVIPLGATVNMNGTALYEAVAAMYVASLYGIHLPLSDQIVVLLTATLAAIGAAGIPEAGLITMVMVLQSVNLPVEGIGMILAVDWILDRLRTTVNVWGDMVGAGVIGRMEE